MALQILEHVNFYPQSLVKMIIYLYDAFNTIFLELAYNQLLVINGM